MASSTSNTKRKWLLILSVPILVIVLFVALLPMFISAGLGHGRILAMIRPHIHGQVDFDSLRVRWFGPQEMRELRIWDEAGNEVANLDARANLSLFALIFGAKDVIELDVAVAQLDGTLYEDGTTSFQRLIRRPDAPAPTVPPRPREPEVIELAGVPELRINIDLHTVNLRDEASGRSLLMSAATGRFHYEPNGRVSLTFESDTTAEGLDGRVTLSAIGDQLFDARGRFTPAQGSATINLEAISLPLLGLEESGELQRVTLNVKSAQLTDRFIVELEADAQVEEMEPSRLDGAVTLMSLFRQDGRMDFRLGNLSGTVSGARVPSSIVQPFLAGTPIVLTRDAGPTVDAEMDFIMDEGDDPPGRQTIAVVRVNGSRYNARLEADATIHLETGEWEGRRLLIASDRAHPGLVEGYTGLRITEPTDVVIELSSFGLPPVDETLNRRPLTEYSAEGTIAADGPLRIVIEAPDREARTVIVEQVRVSLDSPRLGDVVSVRGSAIVEGGVVSFEERITHLFDDEGMIDAYAAKPVGTVTIDNVPSRVLLDWMPEHEELLSEALGDVISGELVTRTTEADDAPGGEVLVAELNVRSAGVTSNATIQHFPDRLHIAAASTDITISPRLAEIAQRDQERPIVLLEPLAMALELEPLTLWMDQPFVPRMPDAADGPVRLAVNVPHAALDNIGALAEPIDLRNFEINLGVLMSEVITLDTVLTGTVHRHEGGNRIARINADLNIEPGEVTVYRGEVGLQSVRTARLESVLGLERNALMDWLGDNGNVIADITGRGMDISGTIDSTMPRLAGRFNMSLDAAQFALRTDRADINVRASLAQRLINRGGPVVAHVEEDLPLRLLIRALRVPATLLFGDPAEGNNPVRTGHGNVTLDMELTGGPAKLRHDDDETRIALEDIHIQLQSTALREGLIFNLAGEAIHDDGQSGTVAVRGAIREMITADDELDFAGAKLDLDADVTRAPTMLIDALLGMNGYLNAAVGPSVDAKLIAQEFSANSGTIDADITSPHGFLRGTGSAHDGLLHISSYEPVTAELNLNPLLREMLLSRLHPILGDLVATDQPLRASLAEATLPMTAENGAVSRLNGNVELTIGSVQFDRRSEMLMMLALAHVTEEPRLDGSIDTIRARIREGVIEYDEFNINIANLTLPQSGRIDLNTGQVRLRTLTLLGTLATAFIPRTATEALDGRLGHVIREINVPIIYTGTFDDLSVRIDPEFRLEERIGRILAEELLFDRIPDIPGIPFNPRGILDDLFRNNPRNNQPKP